MLLSKWIADKGGVMGTTAEGKEWCLGALHGADALSREVGIPDLFSQPTVIQKYQFGLYLGNPVVGVGTWDIDLWVHPNPVYCMTLRTRDSAGNYLWSLIPNQQVGNAGDNAFQKRVTFANTVEQYRLCKMCVTGHLDAAAVNNAGQFACAQYPVMKNVVCGSHQAVYAPGAPLLLDMYSELPKTFEQLRTMPNSYADEAKHGCYAVYKLSETCQQWKSARDHHRFMCYGRSAALTPGEQELPGAFPAAAITMAHITNGWPYGVSGCYTGSTPSESVALQNADVGVMHLAWRNLAPTAAINITYRSAYEIMVSPGSLLTTFLKMSPQYDPTALASYFAISREMKDGYPESYNSLGALLPLIGKIATTVLPQVLPLMGGAWRGMKSLFNDGEERGDKVTKRVLAQVRANEKAPLAQVERQQKANQVALEASTSKAGGQKKQRRRRNRDPPLPLTPPQMAAALRAVQRGGRRRRSSSR